MPSTFPRYLDSAAHRWNVSSANSRSFIGRMFVFGFLAHEVLVVPVRLLHQEQNALERVELLRGAVQDEARGELLEQLTRGSLDRTISLCFLSTFLDVPPVPPVPTSGARFFLSPCACWRVGARWSCAGVGTRRGSARGDRRRSATLAEKGRGIATGADAEIGEADTTRERASVAEASRRTFPAGLGFTAFAAALACSRSSICQFIVAAPLDPARAVDTDAEPQFRACEGG